MNKAPNQKQSPGKPPFGPGKNPLPKYNRGPFSWLVIGLIVMALLMMVGQMQKVDKIESFTPEFTGHIEKGYIKSIVLKPTSITGEYSTKWSTEKGADAAPTFKLGYDPDLMSDDFIAKLGEKGIEVSWAEPDMFWPFLFL